MSGIARVLGPVVFLLGVAACASSTQQTQGATQMQAPNAQCKQSGEHCRWDNQCCSGRCYVDLGCSG